MSATRVMRCRAYTRACAYMYTGIDTDAVMHREGGGRKRRISTETREKGDGERGRGRLTRGSRGVKKVRKVAKVYRYTCDIYVYIYTEEGGGGGEKAKESERERIEGRGATGEREGG